MTITIRLPTIGQLTFDRWQPYHGGELS